MSGSNRFFHENAGATNSVTPTVTHKRRPSPTKFSHPVIYPDNTSSITTAMNEFNASNVVSASILVSQLAFLYENTPLEGAQGNRELKRDAADLLRNTGLTASQLSLLKELIEINNVKQLAKLRGIDFDCKSTKDAFIQLVDNVYPQQVQTRTVSASRL